MFDQDLVLAPLIHGRDTCPGSIPHARFIPDDVSDMRKAGDNRAMRFVRVVVECLSKAMIAVAVMISVAILAGNPSLDTPSRPVAATLLALGVLGLVALQSSSRPSRR